MSQAKNATTAKQRANIAVRMIKHQEKFGRSFDDCFEMGDGDQVMNHIIEKVRTDKKLALALLEKMPKLGTPEANKKMLQAIEDCLSDTEELNLFNCEHQSNCDDSSNLLEFREVDDIYDFLEALQVKRVDHSVLLHGTTLSSLKEIATNRLFVPQKRNGSDALANHYKAEHFIGYNFFTNDDDNAGHYSMYACSNQGEYDNNGIQTIVGVVLPEQLLLPDLCDAPESTDWKDSLKQIHSVSVKGALEVPEDNLFLLFSDYETGEPLYLTTELNGEKAFKEAEKIKRERYMHL